MTRDIDLDDDVGQIAEHLGAEIFERDMRKYGPIPLGGAATRISRSFLARVAKDFPAVATLINEDPPSEMMMRLARDLINDATMEIAKMYLNIGIGAIGQIVVAQAPTSPPVAQGPSTPQ